MTHKKQSDIDIKVKHLRLLFKHADLINNFLHYMEKKSTLRLRHSLIGERFKTPKKEKWMFT